MKLFKFKKEKVNNNKYRIIKDNINKQYTIEEYIDNYNNSILSYFELNNNIIEERIAKYNIDNYSDENIIELKNIFEYNNIDNHIIDIDKHIVIKVIINDNNKYEFKYALILDCTPYNIMCRKFTQYKIFDDLESAKKYINDSVVELK
jgi:hypothetical protein